MSKHYQVTAQQAREIGRVLVLMGGSSAEREVSLNSGSQVLEALKKAGVDAFGMDYQDDAASLIALEFDRVFVALHGRGGEDGTLQGLLEMMGKPYTGSGVSGSALAMDKCRSKFVWQGMNLPTPRFGYVENEDSAMMTQLVSLIGFPLAVKPVREGSSFGISKVTNQSQLEAAISEANRYDERVLLEKWVDGDEFTVALLDGEALPVIGLKTDHAFYDYQAKYESSSTEYLLPSGLKPEEESSVAKLCLNAFNALGCKGWGRVDVMRDRTGRFWLLEVNTVPGMTDHSLVPMAAAAAGISFSELVVRVVAATVSADHSHGEVDA